MQGRRENGKEMSGKESENRDRGESKRLRQQADKAENTFMSNIYIYFNKILVHVCVPVPINWSVSGEQLCVCSNNNAQI